MAKFDTKLKLGRKLDGVDAATAGDNQASVLFRFDEAGLDRHVSLSVESDEMTVDDVGAVLALLDKRGILTRHNSKTWVSQPQASEARFGSTRTWRGADVHQLADSLTEFYTTTSGVAAAVPSDQADDVLARLREAERRVADVERALASLKTALAAPPP